MELALNQSIDMDLGIRIKETVRIFRMIKIEQMLSSALEGMPNKSCIDYIGELNKNDIMH